MPLIPLLDRKSVLIFEGKEVWIAYIVRSAERMGEEGNRVLNSSNNFN